MRVQHANVCGVVVFYILGRGGEGRGGGRGGEGRGGKEASSAPVQCASSLNGTDLHIAPLLVQRIPQSFADHFHDNALSKKREVTTREVCVAVT